MLPHNGNKVELLAAVCNASGDCTLNVELRLRVTVNNQKFPPDLPADALGSDGRLRLGAALRRSRPGAQPDALVDGAYVGFWDYVDPGQQCSSTRRHKVDRVVVSPIHGGPEDAYKGRISRSILKNRRPHEGTISTKRD